MKKGLILFFAGLMALGLASCRHEVKETAVELTWDTIAYKQEITDMSVPGFRYEINVVLPKDSLNEAYTSIRQQLLKQLFAMPIFSEDNDSIALDLTDAQGCLTAYMKRNQKILDDVVSSFETDGIDPMGYEMHWENTLELKPVMVNDTLITFMLNYYAFTGGVHGIYGSNYTTFDVRTGEQIHDKDIFKEGTASQLDGLLQSSLMHYCEGNEVEELSTDNFEIEMLHTNDNYYLTRDSIYYTFNVYEIASYAFGSHTFGFSAKEALPYLNKESIVYQYWNLK